MPKKKLTNNYWDEKVMSDHITHYNSLTDQQERSDYFEKYIHKPLNRLAEYLANTWKWPYIQLNHIDMQADLLSFLTEKLPHYKEKFGRSFAFLSVIGKRYLIQSNNLAYKRSLVHISLNGEDDDGTPVADRLENHLLEKHQPPAAFCDDDFLTQLTSYFKKTQLDNQMFFSEKYNPVMIEVLNIVKDKDYHSIDGGSGAFNKLVRENKVVADLDEPNRYSVKTNAKTSDIIKRIKKVSRAAYKYYLNHGNLNDFAVNRTVVFDSVIQAQKKREQKRKSKMLKLRNIV